MQRTVERVLRRKAKYGEVTIEKIQKSISLEVDYDFLLNIVNNIVNTSEFYQTVQAGEGKISFAFTEKGRREENRSTRKTLRKVDRDFRKKEASRSFTVNEVGLGGQVVNSYRTSKKGMGWSIFIVVAAIDCYNRHPHNFGMKYRSDRFERSFIRKGELRRNHID